MILHEPTKLSADGTVTTDGETPADPTALAGGADLAPNTYALARMIASEAGSLPTVAQHAVGFVAWNYARAHGRTLLGTLTRSITAGNGFFRQTEPGALRRHLARHHRRQPSRGARRPTRQGHRSHRRRDAVGQPARI